MRIALCYSGQPRSFEKTFSNHRHALIDFNDVEVDMFAHFWEPSSTHKEWISNLNWSKIIFEGSKDEEFKRKTESDAAFTKASLPFKVLSMFYGVEKSIDLALKHEHTKSIKYDFIFRMRTDLFFLYNTLTKLEDHDNSKLNISPDRPIPFNYSLDDPSRDSVNLCPEAVDDRFAFGNAKVMKKYSSVYSNYKSIIKRRLPASAECLLGINVKDNKLEVCQNNWQIAFYKGGDWSQNKDGRYSIRGGFKNN